MEREKRIMDKSIHLYRLKWAESIASFQQDLNLLALLQFHSFYVQNTPV